MSTLSALQYETNHRDSGSTKGSTFNTGAEVGVDFAVIFSYSNPRMIASCLLTENVSITSSLLGCLYPVDDSAESVATGLHARRPSLCTHNHTHNTTITVGWYNCCLMMTVMSPWDNCYGHYCHI